MSDAQHDFLNDDWLKGRIVTLRNELDSFIFKLEQARDALNKVSDDESLSETQRAEKARYEFGTVRTISEEMGQKAKLRESSMRAIQEGRY